MIRTNRLAALLAAFLPAMAFANQAADVVLRGGIIWTANHSQPRAQAVAARDGRIVYVGGNAGVETHIGDSTRVVELQGHLVVPGFNDNHVHFEHTGRLLYGLNLLDVSGADAFASRVRAVHERFASGTWITGGDWSAYETWATGDVASAGRQVNADYGNLFTPHRNLIDGFTAQRPVLINRFDRKVYLANGRALALAGISRESTDPKGVVVVREADGEPTGILLNPLKPSVDSTMLITDNVRALYASLIPEPSRQQHIAETLRVWQQMREVGVTSYSDVTSSPRQLDIYRELREKGQMTARVRVRPSLERWEDMARLGIGVGFGDEWIRLGAVKAWIDGIMGNSTARFYAPYTHDPGRRGIWRDIMFPFERSPDNPEKMQSRLERLALQADAANIQLTVHAIGDEANGYLMDMAERLVEKNGVRDRRFRLVHAQVMQPRDIERAGRLGIVMEVQPYHCADDMRWMEERIGRERSKGAYAFKSMWDAGAVVSFGSDSPGTNASRYYLNPMLGLYAAVTRQNMAGEPRRGWFPGERLTVEQALTAYTVNTAYAAFEEHIKGSLATGMLADLVVLSDNLLEIDPATIKDVQVQLTMVDGEIVFESDSWR